MPNGRSRRREFLHASAVGTLGMLAGPLGVTARRCAEAASRPSPSSTADTLIVLWMAGGMAHTETFDPKRHAPFSAGMKADEVLCTFPSIDTAVDDVKISMGLERIAKVMNRGTLIRSHVLGDLGQILHSRHQYHWHTGYEPPQTVAAPHLGAWIAHALGPVNQAIPAFIDIGQSYEGNGESEELKAFQTGGCLGSRYNPFRVPDPRQAVDVVRPPAGLSEKRFRRRFESLKKLVDAAAIPKEIRDSQHEALLRASDDAFRLMESPAAKAFDLSLEPAASYELYSKSKFGLGCLLARRLV